MYNAPQAPDQPLQRRHQQQQQQQQQQPAGGFYGNASQASVQPYAAQPQPPPSSSASSVWSPPPLQAPIPQYSSHKILAQQGQQQQQQPQSTQGVQQRQQYMPNTTPNTSNNGFGYGNPGTGIGNASTPSASSSASGFSQNQQHPPYASASFGNASGSSFGSAATSFGSGGGYGGSVGGFGVGGAQSSGMSSSASFAQQQQQPPPQSQQQRQQQQQQQPGSGFMSGVGGSGSMQHQVPLTKTSGVGIPSGLYSGGGGGLPPQVPPTSTSMFGMGGAPTSSAQGPGMAAPIGGGGSQQPNLFSNNFLSDFQGTAAGQIGMQIGSQAFAQVQQNVNQNLTRYVNVGELRYYFNVSTAYVMRKLQLLVMPFRHASWTRLVRRRGDEPYSNMTDGSGNVQSIEGYAPPREDLNAPDLYIPVMSLVTYILLDGLVAGVSAAAAASVSNPLPKGVITPGGGVGGVGRAVSATTTAAAAMSKFTPDRLGTTATSAITITLLEVLLIKFGFYLFNIVNNSRFIEVLAYCGYKFVIAIILVSLKLVWRVWDWSFLAMGLYLIIAYGFFTLRTLRYLVITDTGMDHGGAHGGGGGAGIGRDGRKRRVLYLFAIAVGQCLSILFLLL